MTTTTRSDVEIQAAVQEELDWTPEVDAPGIGVSVEGGTVALSGEVDSFPEKIAAKRATLRVAGVNTVIDNLSVHPKSALTLTETDVAQEVRHALNAAANVPEGVDAEVQGHNVVLTGEVQWNFQREAARRAVQFLHGVHSVESRITLAARPTAADAEERIQNAIKRNALLDANTIKASVEGNKVVLTGAVRSWAEKLQASRAVWASPHVTEVENRIIVRA